MVNEQDSWIGKLFVFILWAPAIISLLAIAFAISVAIFVLYCFIVVCTIFKALFIWLLEGRKDGLRGLYYAIIKERHGIKRVQVY